jgi:predicted O-methyltransferase YrrM
MSAFPNWFTHYAEGYFARHLSGLAGRPHLRFLQIGAFTGDASVWLLDNILTGEDSLLVDVDTWRGSGEPEHEPFDWADVEAAYDRAVANRALKHRGSSAAFFREATTALYDFIYVDGDHTAAGVLADAVHGFNHLVIGGLMAFDDYRWKPEPDAPPHLAPALAIDAFTTCYRDRLEIVESRLQVWVRKLA